MSAWQRRNISDHDTGMTCTRRMGDTDGVKGMRQYRTVLEQKIRERRQTFEEFAETLETFAREHGERGTLSVRHLQRLASGRGPNGRPLGPVQPATARLLEHVLNLSIDELLAPPQVSYETVADVELRQRLHASKQVDGEMLTMLRGQLGNLRCLDRQMGAIVAHEEVKTKIDQVADLLAYSILRGTREPLAALLSELCCLAGWQALDLGRVDESWRHYDNASKAAAESGIPSFMALAAAGRAFVMIDIGSPGTAVELADSARVAARRHCSSMLRSWLAAAYGETLAGDGQVTDSMTAFDIAASLLGDNVSEPGDPYVALDTVHLARWRGHALARSGKQEATGVLTDALGKLDPSFSRATAALRVDLAMILAAIGEYGEAQAQAEIASQLAARVGSVRQRRRLSKILSA